MSNSFNRIELRQRGPNRAGAKSGLLLFGLFFTGIPLVFICMGANLALQQDSKIHTYQPVQAHIDSSTVHTSRGSKGGSSYTPDITFEYDVAGQHYTGTKPMVSTMSTSDYNWARGIADRYHQGQVVQAYYNPVKPQEAFLIKEHNFFPYFFIVFPMIHLTVGLAIILTGLGFFGTTQPVALAQADGRYRVKPDISLQNRRLFALAACAWWYGVGGLVLGHFFFVTENKGDTVALIVTFIYSLLGLVAVFPALKWSRILHEMSDPILIIKTSPINRGDTTDVEVTFKTNTDLRVKDVQVGMLCEARQTTRTGNSTRTSRQLTYQDWQTIPEDRNFRSDQKFKVEAKVAVPQAEPSHSIVFGQISNRWMIGVKVRVEKGTDYFGKFPIDLL